MSSAEAETGPFPLGQVVFSRKGNELAGVDSKSPSHCFKALVDILPLCVLGET